DAEAVFQPPLRGADTLEIINVGPVRREPAISPPPGLGDYLVSLRFYTSSGFASCKALIISQSVGHAFREPHDNLGAICPPPRVLPDGRRPSLPSGRCRQDSCRKTVHRPAR